MYHKHVKAVEDNPEVSFRTSDKGTRDLYPRVIVANVSGSDAAVSGSDVKDNVADDEGIQIDVAGKKVLEPDTLGPPVVCIC